jgi:hypothetical protein
MYQVQQKVQYLQLAFLLGIATDETGKTKVTDFYRMF